MKLSDEKITKAIVERYTKKFVDNINQDVIIHFLEAINISTFVYIVMPDPGGWTWTWNANNTSVRGTHNNFQPLTTYTFWVTAAEDLAGNPLISGFTPNT